MPARAVAAARAVLQRHTAETCPETPREIAIRTPLRMPGSWHGLGFGRSLSVPSLPVAVADLQGSMSYGGFYTRQEQEDVLASRIDNPNRVGSGFINFGPMERNANRAPAANWQTSSLVGAPSSGAGAPQQVSQIWASPSPTAPLSQQPHQRPPPPTSMQMPVPPQSFSGVPGASPFGAPPPSAGQDVNGLFSSFSIDPKAQARPTVGAAFPGIGNGIPPAPVQSAFMNGAGGPPAPQAMAQAGTSSLMSMLNAPPPPPPPSLSQPFGGGLGNGSMPPNAHSSMQAAFNSMPPVTQRQMPPQPAAFGSAPGYGGPSSGRAHPPAAAAVPKKLSSASDYGAAAMAWKPPSGGATHSNSSVARKPATEPSATATSRPATAATPRAAPTPERVEEWECPRCTFLNNGSLWECEMCAFQRPGKHEQQAAAITAAASARAPAESDDAGWRPAGRAERKPAASAQQNAAALGKSKAQAKNEKRRAKKRSDGTFE